MTTEFEHGLGFDSDVEFIRHVYEHLIPVQEWDQHEQTLDCNCEPFAYVRMRDGVLEATEIRHNSFTSLPVDEDTRTRHARGQE